MIVLLASVLVILAVTGVAVVRIATTPEAAGKEIGIVASEVGTVVSWTTRQRAYKTFTDASVYLIVNQRGLRIHSIDFEIEGAVRAVGRPLVARLLPGGTFPDTLPEYPPSGAELQDRKLAAAVAAEGQTLGIPEGETLARYIILIGLSALGPGTGYRGFVTVHYSVPGHFRKRVIKASSSMTVCVGAASPGTTATCRPQDQ